MAGAGFKDFAVGEVLTASDVDTYLMQQSVMRFADSAARGSALGTATGAGTALAEGMVSYLDDVDQMQVYDGSAWAQVGGLVAVKHALFTGTQSASVAAGAGTAVTGLSITHTLADASNKLIISAYFGAAGSSEGQGRVGIAVADDGTLIGVGDTAGDRTSVGAGGAVAGTTGISVVSMPSVTFVYAPGDTNSHTYTVNAINIRENTRTLYINRSESDTDTEERARASSALVIQEVQV